MAAHNEIKFEEYIVKKLVENGWKEGGFSMLIHTKAE